MFYRVYGLRRACKPKEKIVFRIKKIEDDSDKTKKEDLSHVCLQVSNIDPLYPNIPRMKNITIPFMNIVGKTINPMKFQTFCVQCNGKCHFYVISPHFCQHIFASRNNICLRLQ